MADFFTGLDVVASGLAAERLRMNVSSSNLANAMTTRTEEGGPYRRRDVVFKSENPNESLFDREFSEAVRGVSVSDIYIDTSEPRMVHRPDHPDADAAGNVAMPNINMVEEMVNMMTATRTYEANVNAMSSILAMARKTLDIGR